MSIRATTFYKVTVYYCFVEDGERRRRLPSPPPQSSWQMIPKPWFFRISRQLHGLKVFLEIHLWRLTCSDCAPISSVFPGTSWCLWWSSNVDVSHRFPKWLHNACIENRFCHVLQQARNLRSNHILDSFSGTCENCQFHLGSTVLPIPVALTFHLCVMKHSSISIMLEDSNKG